MPAKPKFQQQDFQKKLVHQLNCKFLFSIFTSCLIHQKDYLLVSENQKVKAALHYIFTSHIYVIYLHHIFTSYIYVIYLHHIFTSYIYVIYLHHIFTSHVYVIYLRHIFKSYIYVIYLLHIFT